MTVCANRERLLDRILPSAASSRDATSLHMLSRRFRAACIRRLTDDLSVIGQRPFQRKIRDLEICSVGFYDHVGIQHPSNHSKRCVCVCMCVRERERCLFNDAVSFKDYVASAIGDLLSV